VAYWNDDTLTGLTAWRDQTQDLKDEALEDAKPTDDGTAAEDASITDEEADPPPMQDPSALHDATVPPITDQAIHPPVAATTVDPAVFARDPGNAPEMLEESSSPPLLQVDTVQRSSSTASPPQWFQSPPRQLNPQTGQSCPQYSRNTCNAWSPS
jgi:hypothetical protein